MATTTDKKAAIKGGEFLIRETLAHEIFIPEEFNEEQKMIQQQCKDFLQKEVLNRLDEIDSMKDPKLMPSLLDKAGELGLLGTSVPTEYGGFGMDFNTTMLVAEVIGAGHSVAVRSQLTRELERCRLYTMVVKTKRKSIYQNWLLANTRPRIA